VLRADTDRRRSGDPRPAGHLPDPAHRDDRRHQQRAGRGPGPASFTTALNAARDQVIHAAGTVIDLVGKVGRLVLDDLLPERRLRVNARTVKRAISKFNARGPNIDRRTYQATISLTILAGLAFDDQPGTLTSRH
jgi:hypothetical protein